MKLSTFYNFIGWFIGILGIFIGMETSFSNPMCLIGCLSCIVAFSRADILEIKERICMYD